jgi:hypothetical protein
VYAITKNKTIENAGNAGKRTANVVGSLLLHTRSWSVQ